MNSMWENSTVDGGNSQYLENLYELYLDNPQQVPAQWRQFFEQLPSNGQGREVSHQQILDEIGDYVRRGAHTSAVQPVSNEHELKQIQVLRLINAYRLQGHLHAQIDPLGMREILDENAAELSLEAHGLGNQDMGTVFNTETFVGPTNMPLGQLYKALNDTYCGSIGTEYMHIPSVEEREWIQQRIEGSRATPIFDQEKKLHILERLTAAEGLEKYLGVKYPGAKRFSLEGGESLIPLLDELVQRSGSMGVRECIIGMAHRGRLNVLINTLGKQPRDLFDEFEGKRLPSEIESGDVKYHMGFSSDVETQGGVAHLAMAFNPSHLEIVTPVVLGSVRARQNRSNDQDLNKVMPIAIHGDASFAGQGVVMETLNMSQTRGYKIGGTVHIVINNQVGFTTSNPQDLRSTLYCTDVAKVILAPIFHVNADDPEAVVFVAQLVNDYRQRFNKDVVIDLVCYRRHGHNEADDPFATQPVMYSKIKKHASVKKLYADQLVRESVLTEQQVQEMVQQNRAQLEKGECVANKIIKIPHKSQVPWENYFTEDWREPVKTAISHEEITKLAKVLTSFPESFKLHPRVAKIYEDRKKMAANELPVDWGFAETLAYASLIEQDVKVRISGQDCGRGTFFHRHAVLHEQQTGERYIPLQHVGKQKNNQFLVIDSLLSEEAVLAFEYGYASTDPTSLVIWEAQFGDFANGAQVVIDQFISSGQQKWGRLCGLVMLLPHGYEGQGPEHSSARLERFMQLCAQHNMQVCVPSTAAQVFHMLRRQMLRKLRKPLIVMSPKSLLRHKGAACRLEELTHGTFQVVIPEVEPMDPAKVERVILCSGKVYFDLVAKRQELGKKDVAIARIEQLYPFPEAELSALLNQYPNATRVIWCQEEPKNQGAWYSSQHHLRACLTERQTLHYAGREASASPAVGYVHAHTQQQEALVMEALN